MAEGEGLSQNDAIDQQLAAARAELAALEQAVDALPHILEAKFRQGVAAVVETNRHLYVQQMLLQQQCAAQLPPATAPRAWRWPVLRRPALKRVAAATAGAAVLLIAVGSAARWAMRPVAPQRPALVKAPVAAVERLVVLRSSGTSWVEVQDLATREVVFFGLLEAGERRTLPMGRGLRLRSGRPDLLSLQIGDAPPVPVDQNQGLNWRIVVPPPTLRTAGA